MQAGIDVKYSLNCIGWAFSAIPSSFQPLILSRGDPISMIQKQFAESNMSIKHIPN